MRIVNPFKVYVLQGKAIRDRKLIWNGFVTCTCGFSIVFSKDDMSSLDIHYLMVEFLDTHLKEIKHNQFLNIGISTEEMGITYESES